MYHENTKASILIVDDDPANLHLLSNLLTLHGFSVRPVPDGHLALSAIENLPPDLILLDIMMPHMNGFEICQRLKADEQTREIPIIFLSALHDAFDKVKAFSLGAVDYITKPFNSEEVLARITTHLSLRQLQQQLQEEHERFQRLSEVTFEGILIHNDNHILEANHAMERMFGYLRNEFLGRSKEEFVTPGFHSTVRQHVRDGSELPYEAEGRRKDGTIFPIEIYAKMMAYQGREIRVAVVRDLTRNRQLEEENRALKLSLSDRYKFGELVGKSPVMQAVYQAIVRAAVSDANVLIYGESGTGKELVARTIHQQSTRHEQPFVAVNCSAVPDNLFEREFFGHRKGAFTGADRDKPGYFDRAHGGTLFLDEIGELRPALQVKLLRVLEDNTYIPLGDTRSKHVDVRIIAATNKDLTEKLRQGTIRKDFFYRIYVITLAMPPLQERAEDIPLLVDHFLQQFGDDRTCATLPKHLMTALCSYRWPGNVRELQNELQRFLAGQSLEFIRNTPEHMLEKARVGREDFDLAGLSFNEAVEAFEKHLLAHALAQNAGHQAKTCDMLQIPPKTLYRKMRKYGLKDKKELS